MRRLTLACASVLLVAGFAAGCGDDGGDDDSADNETTSAAPTDESPTDESPTDETSEDESSDEPGEETPTSEVPTDPTAPPTVDPANEDYCEASEEADAAEEVDDLMDAVEDLEENLPASAGDSERAGLAFLKATLAQAKTMNEFVTKVQAAQGEDQQNVAAYGQFEDQTCPDATP